MIGEESRDLVLVDVTPLNLGIKLHGGQMAVIVPAQTSIPCRLSHTFTTVHDFQTTIETEVYQGNRPIAKDNRLIGNYTMVGIPAAPAGVPKIQVTFDISANGTIHVTSLDEASKATQDIVINMSGGLSANDIERMKREAQDHKVSDEARQDLLKLKDSCQRDVQNIKKGISQHKSLTPQQTETLNQAVAQAERVFNNSDKTEELEKAVAELKGISSPIFGAAYNATA